MKQEGEVYDSPSTASIVAVICAALMMLSIGFNIVNYTSDNGEADRLRKQVKDLQSKLDLLSVNVDLSQTKEKPLAESSSVRESRTGSSTNPAVEKKMMSSVVKNEVVAESKKVVSEVKAEVAKTPAPLPVNLVRKSASVVKKVEPVVAPQEDIRALAGPAKPVVTKPIAEIKPNKPKVEVKSSTAPVIKQLAGKVVEVSLTDSRAIIDLGRSVKVLPGMRFNVFRKGKWVAELRAIKVFAGMSSCKVVGGTDCIRRFDDIKQVIGQAEKQAD